MIKMEKKPIEPTIQGYTLELNTLIVEFVREYIKKTKEFYKLSDEEIANIIGIDGDAYRQLMNENFNGTISSGIISTMYIITGGKFNISDIAANMVFDELIFNKEIQKITDKHRQKKMEQLLECLQIDSDEKLDEFLGNFNTVRKIFNNKEELMKWLNGK